MAIALKKNEIIEDLQINNFKIIQRLDGFKFGTDAVQLAKFIMDDIKESDSVIDLGTGTGIISILLAAYTKAKSIVGLEIQPDMCELAAKSVSMNALEDRIRIVQEDICNIKDKFPAASFNCVVSNPPYKKAGSGLINPNDAKAISRHEVLCSLEDVVCGASYLLEPGGIAGLVHRPDRLADIMYLLRLNKLEPKRMRFISYDKNKAPSLVMIMAKKGAKPFMKVEPTLLISDKQ